MISQKRFNIKLHRKYSVDSHWMKQDIRVYASGIHESNEGLDSVTVDGSTCDNGGLICSVVYILQRLDV